MSTFTPPPAKIRIGDRKWPGMTLKFGGVECVHRDAWDAAAGEIERLRTEMAEQAVALDWACALLGKTIALAEGALEGDPMAADDIAAVKREVGLT